MRSSRVTGLLVCIAAALAAGCAARGSAPLQKPAAPLPQPAAREETRPAGDSLGTFIGKVRTISAQPARTPARTIEAQDPALARALLILGAAPTAARHRTVAEAYLRLGILDKAHEHLGAAVARDHRDAAAWDGLARIWRDWGMPHLGLTDAYRAVYFAPWSAVTHNTLGTILQALGRHDEARLRYERALQLDATAAYALNNLCYSWAMQGQVREAVAACQRALAIRPDVLPTQNNLGLAFAIGGSLDDSERAFAAGGEPARAHYNMGIVHLARRQHAAALKEFDAAHRLRPDFGAAAVMAHHAWQHTKESAEP